MISKKQIRVFKRFLQGVTSTEIGVENNIGTEYVYQLCRSTAYLLYADYLKAGSPDGGVYQGEVVGRFPFVKKVSEVKEHKDFWLKLCDDVLLEFRKTDFDNTKSIPEQSIEILNLNRPAYIFLLKSGFDTINKLIVLTKLEVMEIRGISKISLNEIEEKLAVFHLSLKEVWPPVSGVGENATMELNGKFTKKELKYFLSLFK